MLVINIRLTGGHILIIIIRLSPICREIALGLDLQDVEDQWMIMIVVDHLVAATALVGIATARDLLVGTTMMIAEVVVVIGLLHVPADLQKTTPHHVVEVATRSLTVEITHQLILTLMELLDHMSVVLHVIILHLETVLIPGTMIDVTSM